MYIISDHSLSADDLLFNCFASDVYKRQDLTHASE